MKACCGCKQSKPLSSFSLNRSRKDGFDSYCKSCRKKRYESRIKKDPDYNRCRNLRNRYGLQKGDYNSLLNEQNAVCLICKLSPETSLLAVDHCHLTGKVRGLLCLSCNSGLGYFKDKIYNLKSAIKYLQGQG